MYWCHYPLQVHCKRFPTSDDFTLYWLVVDTEGAPENQSPTNTADSYALVDVTAAPVPLSTCPSLRLDTHAECLLQVIWTPRLPSNVASKPPAAGRQASPSALRHVLQFRVNRTSIVEAVIVASTIKQSREAQLAASRRGAKINTFIGRVSLSAPFAVHTVILWQSLAWPEACRRPEHPFSRFILLMMLI